MHERSNRVISVPAKQYKRRKRINIISISLNLLVCCSSILKIRKGGGWSMCPRPNFTCPLAQTKDSTHYFQVTPVRKA
jgi:hypothetical protein